MVKRCIETEMERRLFDIKYRLSCSDNFAYFNYYMYFERKIIYIIINKKLKKFIFI